MQKTISIGAEAIILLKNNEIIKRRIKKEYRIPFIDEKLRKSRTKSESKIIEKLKNIIPVPKLIKTDNREELILEYIKGDKLSEHLENLNYQEISKQIARTLTKLHNQNVIHGDLTTSNMILSNKKIYLIDFGLSFHSHRIEDKAVDLHLLQQALNAKHDRIAKECFKIILKNYKSENNKEILERIKKIESRGRYKNK